jgi:hypothetical protein
MEEEMRGLSRRARETVTFDTRQRFAMVSSVVGMQLILVDDHVKAI